LSANFKVLDGLRGLSALYILVHHARQILTQPYNNGLSIHPDKYSVIDKSLVYAFSFFKYGHEAVIIFFVLSGFVIHLKQADKNYNYNTFSISNYLKKRIKRIYPTLITSFILCVIIDFIISKLLNQSLSVNLSKYSFSTFLYNLFLIPNTADWGNNFPLWSLKHEWTFYLLYPLLLILSNFDKKIPIIVVITFYLSYTLGYRIPYINNVAYSLAVWFLGFLLAEIYQKKKTWSKIIPYFTLLIIIYPFINREKNELYPYLDLTFGLIVMGLLSILIQNKTNFVNRFLSKFSFLGTFSYSLYLLHWPILILIMNIVLINSENVIPYHYWYVIASIFISTLLIYIIYLFTEKKFINYKKH
jgi:peptidoglycan/LPS O-acetylase OafA/YrhL